MRGQGKDGTAAQRPLGGPRIAQYIVGRVDDFADGDRKIVEVGGRSVGVFRVDGEFYAMLNRCPHGGGPLCQGPAVNNIESSQPGEYRIPDDEAHLIMCPWHGWEFDVKTGQSYFDPLRTRAKPFPVSVESGEVVQKRVSGAVRGPIAGPYLADTVPVSVEDDYVMVTLRAR